MKKKCNKCGLEKDLEEFPKDNSKADGRRWHCLECQRLYTRSHYRKNKAQYLKRNKAKTAENTRLLHELLRTKKCFDCGEDDPVVLDFDHRNKNEKKNEVTRLAHGGYPWSTILKEIKKCDIRCANCHRRRTSKQFGWIKGMVP